MVLGVELTTRSLKRNTKMRSYKCGRAVPTLRGSTGDVHSRQQWWGYKQKGSPRGCGTKRFSPSPLASALATVLTKGGKGSHLGASAPGNPKEKAHNVRGGDDVDAVVGVDSGLSVGRPTFGGRGGGGGGVPTPG